MAYVVTISHIDTCYPEYLTDHHNREGEYLIGVPVDAMTLTGTVRDMVADEFWRSDDIPDAVTADMLEKALDDELPASTHRELFDPTLDCLGATDDDAEDCDESPQACRWNCLSRLKQEIDMRLPSVKTLSAVFADPKAARKVLEMDRRALCETEAGAARLAECWNEPATSDLRMTVLNSLDEGLFGVEGFQATDGEWVEYLNTGETYADTVIRWRGAYRVQSMGDFIETQERNGVRFE